MYGLTSSLLASLHVTSHSTFFSRIVLLSHFKISSTKKLCYSVLSLLLGIASLLSLYYPFHYCLVNSYIFIIHVCSNVSSLGIFFLSSLFLVRFHCSTILKNALLSLQNAYLSLWLCNHVKSFCVVVCVIILKAFPRPPQCRFQIPWEWRLCLYPDHCKSIASYGTRLIRKKT